jgi:hypothetical protein
MKQSVFLGPIVSKASSSNFIPLNIPNESNSVMNLVVNDNSSSPSTLHTNDLITTSNLTNGENGAGKQFDESSASNLGLDELPHMAIRTKAADVYLSRTTRQQHAHRAHLQSLREKCNIGDFVGLRIDKVDRTNTDPKILPCVVVERKDEQVKLACVYGIIDQWWSIDSVIGLSAVPDELVNLKMNDLRELSMITASKLYVRGAVNGVCCSCKGGCKTKQCACRKNNVFCSTKCHKSNVCCKNMEE